MSSASWPELKGDHPIITLFKKLPEVLTTSEGYNQIWGLTLDAPTAAPPTESADAPVEQPSFGTALILQKFLRANANDVAKAFSQLTDTMVWRKTFFAPDGESSKGWSDAKFQGVGYITTIKHKSGKDKVVSWNIYGATKDIKATFGSLDEFIRWRVNLMEESLKRLKLADVTVPIPDYGKGDDPYMGLQVHDYMNVSFLRLPSEVKAASKKTIDLFARYYPETLERKFFVNVPALMSWVYILLKKVLSNATLSKLEMLGSGKELASWLGEDIPVAYGGNAQPLDAGDNAVHSPKDVDAEAAAEKAKREEASLKKAEEPKVNGEQKVEEPKVNGEKKAQEPAEETAKNETPKEAPKEGAPAVTEPEAKPTETPAPTEAAAVATPAAEPAAEKPTEPAAEAEAPKPAEPLPLTTEPVTAAPAAADEAATKPVNDVPASEDAVPPPKDLSEVPIPAPIPVVEKKEDETKA